MSNHYEAETARLFGRFVERGYVYKGARPVYWCIHDQTALAEAEVEYDEHTSPSVYVKFPSAERPARRFDASARRTTAQVFFLIWTTTPWTLPANLGIAVNPHFEYAAFEDRNGEVYVVASELLDTRRSSKCGLGAVRRDLEASGTRRRVRESNLRQSMRRRRCSRVSRARGSTGSKRATRGSTARRSLMLGDHVTLGGEADAETELDVKEARDKKATGKAGHGLRPHRAGPRPRRLRHRQGYGLEIYCPVDNAGPLHAGGRALRRLERLRGEPDDRRVHARARRAALHARSTRTATRTAGAARTRSSSAPRRSGSSRSTPSRAARPRRRRAATKTGATGRTSRRTKRTRRESLREGALREIERVEVGAGVGRGPDAQHARRAGPTGASRASACGACRSPSSTARAATRRSPTAQIIDHVADIFEQRVGRRVVRARGEGPPARGLHAARSAAATEFTKETDILDVWFDSGVSSVAVLEKYEGLRWPADVYLEGGDQFRGWFNSSLMVGLAAHDRAPYDTVVTHGWVVDGQGKAMHKSAGNAISPNEVIKESGADILRLWVHVVGLPRGHALLAGDPAARRRTPTARCATRRASRSATSTASTPRATPSAEDEMHEIDRWALAELDAVDGARARRLRGLRVPRRLPRALQLLHGDALGALLRHHQGQALHVGAAVARRAARRRRRCTASPTRSRGCSRRSSSSRPTKSGRTCRREAGARRTSGRRRRFTWRSFPVVRARRARRDALSSAGRGSSRCATWSCARWKRRASRSSSAAVSKRTCVSSEARRDLRAARKLPRRACATSSSSRRSR